MAARVGNKSAVDFLIDKGIPTQNEDGTTP